MALNLSGLASGIDTSTIVEQLMALERQPRVRLEWSQKIAETRQTALRDIDSRLTNLFNAAKALRDTSLWAETQTVDTSDATRVTGRRVGGGIAPPGEHIVVVSNVAVAEQRVYAYTPSGSATTITAAGKTFDIAANTDVNGVAAVVNAAGDSPVYAWVDADGELRFVAKQTGTAGAFTASGSTLVEDTTERVNDQDAAYTVDGDAYTSSSNVTTVGIAGVELTLKRSGTQNVVVTVGPPVNDKTALKDKLKAFVDQYNSTYDFVNAKLKEKKVANPTTEADATKGVLYADSSLNGLLRQLRQGVADIVSNGNPTTLDQLSEIGITTGAVTGSGAVSGDAIAGKLAFDETKFTAAWESGSTAVRQLLGGVSGISGFAQRLEGLLDPMVKVGGLLDGRIDSAGRDITRVRDSLTRMDDRLALKESRLKAQFAAMEKVLAASQAQGAWLSGQITQLTSQRPR